MKPLMDNCWKCQALFVCHDKELITCPKMEIATEGLDIPNKSKKDEFVYARHVPFGVYMALKHIVDLLINKGGMSDDN